MASQHITVAYATIDNFLSRNETLAQTIQRHADEQLRTQRGIDAEERRRCIQFNLEAQQSAKRRHDEVEAEVIGNKRHQRVDLRLSRLGSRRTAGNFSMFKFRENPNASRPNDSFSDLLSDKKEAMKIVFFRHHGENADIIFEMIESFVGDTSLEKKVFMKELRSERSRLQTRFFVKAREIAKELVEDPDFASYHDLGTQKKARSTYFANRVTKELLARFYKHVASAVDLPTILAGGTPEDVAFKRFMMQVFVQVMMDLWEFELYPEKQNLPKKLADHNKELLYQRFRSLTDNLPAAMLLPSLNDTPVTAIFPTRNSQQKQYSMEHEDEFSHFDGTDNADIPDI